MLQRCDVLVALEEGEFELFVLGLCDFGALDGRFCLCAQVVEFLC